MRKQLLVDLDGTVVDTYRALCKHLSKTLGREVEMSMLTSEMFSECLGITPGEMAEAFATPGLHGNAEPFPFALIALRELKEEGWKLHIATARRPELRRETLFWLYSYNIPFDSLHLIDTHFTSQPDAKLELVRKLLIPYAVEDNAVYARSLANHCKAVFLPDMPYNKHCDGVNIITVSDLWEMVETLKEMEH
jgi:uncharacterized HAD superfamily protein